MEETSEDIPEEEDLKEKLYEAMFLIDAAKGGAGFPALVRYMVELLERHEAHIEQIEKWAERKLAYEVRGVERGIYVLVFFRLEPSRIAELRGVINLSEEVLRVLILEAQRVAQPTGELLTRGGEPVSGQPAAPVGPGAKKEPQSKQPEEAVVSAESKSDNPQQ